MLNKKSAAVVVAGSGAGLAQVFVLREFVDKEYGKIPGLEGLGGFGTYSAIGGIVGGGVTTALGLVSILTKKITKNETIQLGLISYGIPALSGGILSGLFPHPAVGLKLRAPAPSGRVPAGITLRNPLRNPGPAGQAAPRQPAGQAGIPLRT